MSLDRRNLFIYTTRCNLISRYLPVFTAFFVPEVFHFRLLREPELFQTVSAFNLFHRRKFENGLLEPVYFLSRHYKTSSFKHELISRMEIRLLAS